MNRKMLTAASIIYFTFSTLLAADSVIYSFSDRNPPTKNASAGKSYLEIMDDIEEVFETNKLQNKTDFPEKVYLQAKQNLKQIADQNPDDPIAIYAKRRIIILDWLAGKNDANQTVVNLSSLSEEFEGNEEVKNFNMAFMATVLARDSYLNEAKSTFQKIEPSKTSCYPFYAFEIVKYLADDVQKNQPGIDSPNAGKCDLKDYERRADFADFMEDVFIPQMSNYIESEDSKRIINIVNTQMVLDTTCTKATSVLFEAKYLDLVDRLGCSILPQLIDVWKRSVSVTENILIEHQATENYKKIEYHEKTILPGVLKVLRKFKESDTSLKRKPEGQNEEAGLANELLIEPKKHIQGDKDARETRMAEALAARKALEKLNRPDVKNQLSGPERIRAHHHTLQIPEEELVTLSTEDLVETILSSTPFVTVMISHTFPDGGLSRYTQAFNGAREILIRPDAAKVMLKKYEQFSNQISERSPKDQFIFYFEIMEVLLSSEALMQQASDIELREEVISSIIKSRETRSQYDSSQTEPVYGQATLGYSTLAVAKYLDSLDYSKYQQWFREKSTTGLFSERALTYQESKEVINMGREYIQSIKE